MPSIKLPASKSKLQPKQPIPAPKPKQPASKPKPVVKPSPKPKVSATRKYREFDLNDAVGDGDAVVGTCVGAILAPFTLGTSVALGASLGGAGGALTNTGKWAWNNKEIFVKELEKNMGKIAKIEDPMCKSFPH